MVSKRITFTLTDEQWSNLHVMRLLLAFGSPYVSRIESYADIIKLALLNALFTTVSDDTMDVFIEGSNKSIEPVTISGFPHDYKSFMEQWEARSEKRKIRLISSGVVPRGNLIYTAGDLDIESIEILRQAMAKKGVPDHDLTDPKIIKKSLDFFFKSPVDLYINFVNAYILSVYGIRIYYVRVYYGRLKTRKYTSLVSKHFSKEADEELQENAYEKAALISLGKDSYTLLEFLKAILKNGYSFDTLKNLRKKYWSTLGFDFCDMLVSLDTSLKLLFRQDEWLPDLIFTDVYREINPEVLKLFAHEMGFLLDTGKPYTRIYDSIKPEFEKVLEDIDKY